MGEKREEEGKEEELGKGGGGLRWSEQLSVMT